MIWFIVADIALLVLCIALLWKQKHHMQRVVVMLVGNLILLRCLSDFEIRGDMLIIFGVEIVFFILMTLLVLSMRFAPNAIPWRDA